MSEHTKLSMAALFNQEAKTHNVPLAAYETEHELVLLLDGRAAEKETMAARSDTSRQISRDGFDFERATLEAHDGILAVRIPKIPRHALPADETLHFG